jgi:hypothetical protein
VLSLDGVVSCVSCQRLLTRFVIELCFCFLLNELVEHLPFYVKKNDNTDGVVKIVDDDLTHVL